jgi:hypothetical protein
VPKKKRIAEVALLSFGDRAPFYRDRPRKSLRCSRGCGPRAPADLAQAEKMLREFVVMEKGSE